MRPFVAALFANAQSFSAWDPATLLSNVALSNNNRTATHDGTTSTPRGVRGAAGRSQGKYYFEIALSAQAECGISLNTYNGSGLLGATVSAYGYDNVNGVLRSGGATVLSGLDTFTSGVACFAVDLGAHTLWVRKPGGNWNGNVAYSPAAGTGGVTIASGTFYAASSSGGPVSVWTLDTGNEAFAGVRPTSFYIWE